MVAPPIIARLSPSNEEEFFYLGVFFLVCSLMALAFNMLIHCYDKAKRYNLLQVVEPMEAFEVYIDVRMQAEKKLVATV